MPSQHWRSERYETGTQNAQKMTKISVNASNEIACCVY
jgi:hypothetical protein